MYVLYSAVSSSLDRLKCFTDLFIPAPIRLIWEASRHTAITRRKDVATHISTAVLIYTAE